MKKLVIAVTLILPLLVILAFSPILANQAFAQNQMGVPIMSPRQQMIDTMMQNQQFMNNLVQNQEFMQQLNP